MHKAEATVSQEKKYTRYMRRFLKFLGNARIRRLRDHLLDEENVGETTLAKLPDDSETILIDPNIAATINGVV